MTDETGENGSSPLSSNGHIWKNDINIFHCVVFGLEPFIGDFSRYKVLLSYVTVSLLLQRTAQRQRERSTDAEAQKRWPIRAYGAFSGGGLKETGAATERLRQRVNTGESATDSMRITMRFF